MRIALLLFNIHIDSPSGSAVYTRGLARGLMDNGHDVVAISRHNDDFPERSFPWRNVLVEAPAVYSWPEWSTSPSDLHEALSSYWQALDTVCRELKPDLLHVQHALMTPYLGSLAQQVLGVPFVVTCHGIELEELRSNPTLRSWFWWINNARGVIAVWHHVEEALVQEAVVGRVRTISPGVDLSRFQPNAARRLSSRAKIGAEQGAFVVLFVGRLTNQKGFVDVVASAKHLFERSSRVKLVVCGTGPLEDLALELQSTYSGRVVYLGDVGNDTISELMCGSDLLLMPTRTSEAFSIVCLEGLASGLPIATTREAPFPTFAVEEHDVGVLVTHDPLSIVDAVVRLEANVALRTEMSQRARRFAMQYSWSRITNEIEDAYLDALRI